MRAFVTGSNGFIGSTLVAALLRCGMAVRCMVRKTSNLGWIDGLDVEYSYASFLKPEELSGALADVDLVFHLAGVTKARDQAGYLAGNFSTTQQLLQACAQKPIQNFVYLSSQAAAGPSLAGRPLTENDAAQPISFYGKSKRLAEQAVLDYSLSHPATILRPPSVYGPRDRDIYVYFQNVQRGLLLILGDGSQKVSLIHVDDLVAGILLAAQNPVSRGRIYFISGDGEYDWQNIGRIIAMVLHKQPVTLKVPLWVLDAVSLANRAYAGLTGRLALLNRDKVREMKQPSWLCSSALAKQELAFQPRFDLASGIAQTAAWYQEQGWLRQDSGHA